ncbi:hypothetical protein EUX98_g5539 [Antrodiella citrinella]|uniref:histone deacetylase n=1 Tax=Antrodiella citrinella TaxID=2447956 RepID=A0A4S4MS66_9APHY|nr:hypothetical protein EUX98_g5539 [Antrodiella citrinella]
MFDSNMSAQMAGPSGTSTSSAMDVDIVQSSISITRTEHLNLNAVGDSKKIIPKATGIGYVYDERMMLHSHRTEHTEAPERISRIYHMLLANGYIGKMEKLPIRPVERDEVLLVHSETLWEKVMAISEMSDQDVVDSESYYEELSLYVRQTTPVAARLSCGGVIEATLAVARGQVRKSLAIVRPPGHHAEPEEHMGFCFFNNVSVATRVVQQLTPVKKILILDWDVHHVSAGFDAADGDELGECHVTPGGYAHMTHMLAGLAGGKMVVALEGGYNLDAISTSCEAVTKVLLGEAPPEMPPLVAEQTAVETVWAVALEQSKYWKNVNPKACEPQEEVQDLSFTIPELLKAHRQDYLFREHDMLVVPFATPELEAKFSSQVTCTSDIMENQTLVVFVHEFGNIRTELESVATCNINMEHTYLVDFSKTLITWIRKTKHALLDVNVHPKRTPGRNPNARASVDIMTYLWDNYIQLTDARRVVLIGHGPGCDALMHLIENRTVGVMRTVKHVIQVVGNYNIPMIPRDARDMRDWYHGHSCVVVPVNHHLLKDDKIIKRHGAVVKMDETKPVKLIIKAFPIICTLIESMLKA